MSRDRLIFLKKTNKNKWVLPSFTEICLVLLRIAEFFLGLTWFYQFFTGFYWVLLGFSEFYGVWLNFKENNWVIFWVFTGFS